MKLGASRMNPSRWIATFLYALTLVIACQSPTCAEITKEVISLWPGEVAPGSEGYKHKEAYNPRKGDNGLITHVSKPTLTVHLPPEEKRCGTGVVICPGGGYYVVAIDHEGHALAKWFAERGVVAAVLKYRHGGGRHRHPIPLNDAQRALRIVRSRAEQWKIKSDKIGIAGFSAGGHLATTAGTHYDTGDPDAEDRIEQMSCRAHFMVLAYPVISMQQDITHGGSRRALIGHHPSDELVTNLSNELQVTNNTGPTFIVHTADDPAVNIENCLRFHKALVKHNVPVELHVYEKGGHGYGMLRGNRPIDKWPNLLEGWLKGQKLIR